MPIYQCFVCHREFPEFKGHCDNCNSWSIVTLPDPPLGSKYAWHCAGCGELLGDKPGTCKACGYVTASYKFECYKPVAKPEGEQDDNSHVCRCAICGTEFPADNLVS